MSEETERHGEASCEGGAGGGGSSLARVLLTPHQLETAAAESLRAAWRTQDLYIDHLETLNKQLEGEDEEMVFCCVREVPVECLVEVHISAQGRVMSPDDPGAVSLFSGVPLHSATYHVAELPGLCSSEKEEIVVKIMLLVEVIKQLPQQTLHFPAVNYCIDVKFLFDYDVYAREQVQKLHELELVIQSNTSESSERQMKILSEEPERRSLEKAKEVEDRIKQQYAESQHREKVLVRRLAAKEQEIQDYVSQITELKSSHASLNGRPTLLDPAVNVLILRLKQELTSTKARLEETQNELSAWKFTPDSNTGKKLMAKCRLLHQENEDLGRMTSSGRIAKLEGDLALQKSFSEEVKKSQSELDEFLQELDEDVEGMQSTVLFLQQELRATHATVNGNRPPSPAEKRTYSGSDCSEPPVGKRRRASVLSLDYNEDEEPLTVANGDAD